MSFGDVWASVRHSDPSPCLLISSPGNHLPFKWIFNYNLLSHIDESHIRADKNPEPHSVYFSPALGTTRPKKPETHLCWGGGPFPFTERAEGPAGQELKQGLGSLALLTLLARFQRSQK